MMIEVPGGKVRGAFVVFKKAYGSGWREARAPFKKFVYIEHFNKYRYLLSEVETRHVEVMNGSHGHAYCKTLIVRRK